MTACKQHETFIVHPETGRLQITITLKLLLNAAHI